MNLQTDQFILYNSERWSYKHIRLIFMEKIEDEFTNRLTQSLLILKMNLQIDQFNLTS
jgi:hypothetical protein